VAEDEAIRISQRTKAALAAAKARGVKLGNPHGFTKPVKSTGPAANKKKADKRAQELAHVVERLQAEGLSLSAMAERLNEMGIPTARGGSWHASTVRNVIQRLNSKAGA
jgi:DNA invertase Pin-like site-specific DNA recombinase